ncbi:hypothetical protein ACFXB3_12765 [Streptomyces sp. NPDC059447]|uniref:hypothetical protein n=1 Tax=Streptomyces sp. NPDC059447 TaxID=3346834 RepID=UPI0036C9B654
MSDQIPPRPQYPPYQPYQPYQQPYNTFSPHPQWGPRPTQPTMSTGKRAAISVAAIAGFIALLAIIGVASNIAESGKTLAERDSIAPNDDMALSTTRTPHSVKVLSCSMMDGVPELSGMWLPRVTIQVTNPTDHARTLYPSNIGTQGASFPSIYEKTESGAIGPAKSFTLAPGETVKKEYQIQSQQYGGQFDCNNGPVFGGFVNNGGSGAPQ